VVQKSPKLLDQRPDKIRLKRYSIRTEQKYADWVRRFIFRHGKGRPRRARPSASSARTLCGRSLTPLWRPPSARAREKTPATA